MSSEVRDMINALPAAFQPEKARNARGLVQFDLTGDGGDSWAAKETPIEERMKVSTRRQVSSRRIMDSSMGLQETGQPPVPLAAGPA